MYYTSKEVYEFISKQAHDPITQWKQCKISGADFPIYQSDLDFYDKISPKFSTDKEIGDKLISEKPNFFSRDENGKLKVKIPTPTLCPEERNKSRIQFRNDSKIYRRKCDATGESFISMYSPNKPYKVYHQDFWYSDKRDPFKYGQDIDINTNFSYQFKKLFNDVPKLGMQLKNAENSDYCCVATGPKNCYLSNVCSRSEEVHYSSRVVHSKNSMDCLRSSNIENSYGSILCSNSYGLNFCILCDNSSNCTFSYQLEGCTDCLFCTNLTNQQYCIYNKQYSKEEYDKIKISLSTDYESIERYKKKLNDMIKTDAVFHKDNDKNSHNAIGSFLIDSENMKICFDVISGKKCSYYFDGGSNEISSVDCSYGGDNERCFYSLSAVGYKNCFTTFCRESSNVWYSDMCMNSQDLFGCVGLRNKQYCIFNKQYTKEEYNNLVPQIINNMIDEGIRGEFFDPSLSPFGYNETVAQEYFPLTREEALARGYKRQDNNYDPVIPAGVETLKGDQIPSDISTVTDDILKKILVCEVSGRPFRIVKQELEFYRKHNLPLPRKHPDVRHQERLKQRPPRELHLRNCDKCGKEMVSVYDRNFEGKVYCEECYQKEIYG